MPSYLSDRSGRDTLLVALVALAREYGQDSELMMAGRSAITILPALLLFMVMQRCHIQGIQWAV